MRLFVAADLSASQLGLLREKVEEARLAAPFEFIRWIPEENWHGTLAFLGDRPDSVQVEAAIEKHLKPGPLTGNPGRIQGFPNREHPRLLALRLEPSSTAENMYWRLNRALDAAAHRIFRFHITVARFREPSQEEVSALQGKLRNLSALSGTWEFPSVTLYESVLKQSGAEYRALRTWSL